METRDLELITEHCLEAHRLALARGDKLLSYFIGMALSAAKDASKGARKNRKGGGRGKRRGPRKGARSEK